MNKEKIKFYITEYFSFSKGEKVGILVLVTIIILIVTFSYLISFFIHASPKIDVSEFEKEIANFEQASDSIITRTSSKKIVRNYFSQRPKASIVSSSIKVELNTADSISLEKLPGIGPVFAGRIIKYRTILGGYYSPKQLSEIYGMKPDLLEKVSDHLLADTLRIRKIDINVAEFKEINAHPYISFQQTKLIMKSRFKEKITSLRQLEKEGIFTKDELRRLRPYILITQ